uniref:Peptidase S1 domain-containing protein n=1 Tax=Gopherus evgoodei TaxID=1825980 RepID=A0A8C4WSE3_9SAUR
MASILISVSLSLGKEEQGKGEIIGGHEAQPHSRLYMAYLEIQHEDTKFRCGGFLGLENFMLTAAHSSCIALGFYNKITVTLGKIPVRRRIPHPQYDKTFNNDIMLPQLAKRAKLNGEVGTINLPLANERVEPGTVCSVTGGGSTRTECLLCPDTLQEADVMVMPDAQCPKDPYGSYDIYNPSTMICVSTGNDSLTVLHLLLISFHRATLKDPWCVRKQPRASSPEGLAKLLGYTQRSPPSSPG